MKQYMIYVRLDGIPAEHSAAVYQLLHEQLLETHFWTCTPTIVEPGCSPCVMYYFKLDDNMPAGFMLKITQATLTGVQFLTDRRFPGVAFQPEIVIVETGRMTIPELLMAA